MEPDDQSRAQAIVLTSRSGSSLCLSEGALRRFGRIFPFLFPGRAAAAAANSMMDTRLEQILLGTGPNSLPLDVIVVGRFLRQQFDRQMSVEETLNRAAAILDERRPPPRELPGGRIESDDSPLPDDDWCLRWLRDVEDIRSASLRELYARLLAGKLESPARYTLRTLRIVGEIDASIVGAAMEALPWVVLGHLSVWETNKGASLSRATIQILIEAGLINPERAANRVLPMSDGHITTIDLGNAQLLITAPPISPAPFRIVSHPLTLSGKEIFELVGPPPVEQRYPLALMLRHYAAGAAGCAVSDVRLALVSGGAEQDITDEVGAIDVSMKAD